MTSGQLNISSLGVTFPDTLQYGGSLYCSKSVTFAGDYLLSGYNASASGTVFPYFLSSLRFAFGGKIKFFM